jgi:hypothetical protein
MTGELPANVTPLRPKDRTAAERKRRSRAKQRKRRVMPVTVEGVTVRDLPVTPAGHGDDAQRIDGALKSGRSSVAVRDAAGHADGMSGRSLAVRDAARNAASVAAPDSDYVARLLRLDPDADIGADISAVKIRTSGATADRGTRYDGIDAAAWLAAVALAGAAAWFSIRGMVVLFPGSPMSVVAMACAMESAKLVTAGWLARRWRDTAWIWRLALVAMIAGLALINATGVYAQLVAAHVGERGAAAAGLETQDAALAAKIEVAAGKVADLDRRLGQIDTAVEEAAKRGRTSTALAAMESQRKARAALVDERSREAGALASLKIERASLAAQGRRIETEAAPIRYVAELVGADAGSERAIRWLIALMVLCCDPLAIALTAAAGASHRK